MIYKIASSIFESNIGSNNFQTFLERKLIDVWNLENLQDHTILVKSIVDYKIKTEAFEELLYQTTLDKANEFTVK